MAQLTCALISHEIMMMKNDLASLMTCPWQEIADPVSFSGPNCTISFTRAQGPMGKQFVVARLKGPLYLSDMRAIAPLERADPRCDTTLPYIWDLRGVDYSEFGPLKMRNSTTGLQEFPERQMVRRVHLVSCEIGFGLSRMFVSHAAGNAFLKESYHLTTYDPLEAVAFVEE